VDDERLARDKLRRFLADAEGFRVIGEAANGGQAIALISRERPDVVFLDVQMPGMDGFAVLEGLPDQTLPAVVFVTAHDEYAIRAFEVEAIDYLLKPFDRARLRQTLVRVRRQLRRDSGEIEEKIRRLLAAGAGERRPLRRIAIRSGGRIQSLPVENVSWIEAADNYLKIHAGKSVHLIRETLSELERRLDPEAFIRIHRCAIVRIESILAVESLFHGDYEAVLRSGERLPVGRRYRERLLETIGLRR
jgi:two-component system LytT family response regulator